MEILSKVEQNNSKIDRAREKRDSLFQASIHRCIIANQDQESVHNTIQMIKRTVRLIKFDGSIDIR